MLYVLLRADYDSVELLEVFDGPNGLDINTLYRNYLRDLEPRKKGLPKYPLYKGPTYPLKYGSNSSGSIPEGTPMPVVSSPEYIEYEKEYRQVERLHEMSRKDRLKEWKDKYGGNDGIDIFANYLEKEYGLKKVEHKEVYL